MSENAFREKLDYYWYKEWDKLKPNIQLIASYKEKWPTLVPLFEQISEQNAVFIMIWNPVISRIIYVVDKRNTIGCDASLFLSDNGFDVSMSKIHPDYFHSVLLMNQQGIKYFSEQRMGVHDKIIVNLEGLYKKKNGEYFHFLQQTVCIETDSEGNPFLFLSYVRDITYLKKNGTSNLIIKTPDEVKWWNFNFDKNCLEPVQPVSKQEKRILSLLAEGKSSKEIAEGLFISPSTVDTHRRHLLDKTNCIDTTGMITYTRLVGLL
jgi:DNA-binding CsgD family transcriptional regulator